MKSRPVVFAALVALGLAAAVVAAQRVAAPPKRVAPGEGKPVAGLVSRTMAGADAQAFARALAEAGHAAGFVMPAAERQMNLPADSGEMLTLDEAVGAFTARGTYRVSRHGAVLVFRHVNTPEDVANALEVPRQMYAAKQTFSTALFYTVLGSLARARVGGAVGKEPGAGPECPVEQTVAIPAGRWTTIETLNGLVARTKGIAWLVRFGPRTGRLRLQIGYVCGNGVWSALSVPGW